MESSGDLNKILSNHSHSKFSKSQASSLADKTDPKKRYAAVIQQEKQHERNLLHKKLEKQKHEEEKAYKKHLKAQIHKKKKQLQHLQLEKQSGLEEHKRAAYLAQLKKEKDAIKRMEESERARTAEEKSKARFKQAVERQKDIEKQLNIKATQAKHLRKTHLKTETVERAQAIRFNQSLIDKQAKQQSKKISLQKSAVEQYRKGLSLHGFSQKLLDATKPITLVFKQNEEDGEAMSKAQKQDLRNSQKEKLKAEAEARNRKTAEDRSNQVLSKMQRQREYEAYCKEAEEQQKRYNLRRLEAGKKNQYAGIKPMTLSQIDLNKKLRSQNEFEKMFFEGPQTTLKNEPANKYKITQNKMIDVVVEPKKTEKWVKQPINYADSQSLIPGVSEGHYSFQSEPSQAESKRESHERKKQTKKQVTVKPIIKESNIQQAVDTAGKTRLKQTRLSNEVLRQQLNYSDSEEDSNI